MIVEHTHRHRRATIVLLGLLLAAGAWAAMRSGRSIYPEIAFPRVTIVAERGDTPVRGMLIDVTRPLEVAVSTIPGLLRMRSKTIRGGTEMSLDFQSRTDMREALGLVRTRVAEAHLPPLESLSIERQSPSVFPVISFNVIPGVAASQKPLARARLAEWAELELKPRIARLSDAFMVTVQTGDVRTYEFQVDPLALAKARIGIEDVQQALAHNNVVSTVGRVANEGLQYQVLVEGTFDSPESVLDVAVSRPTGAPVRLAELGELQEAVADSSVIVTGDGQDGVVVSVFLRDGGKVTELSHDVREVIAESKKRVPTAGSIAVVYDQALLVEESIAGVRDAIALGSVLAVIVLLLFLENWRSTLIAGIAIPVSVLLTLALFPVVGESLNLMSLGGLAVAIGLIIDDAIVVVENVARCLAEINYAHATRRECFTAIARGTQEVVAAIIGSSLTTVVVFVPLVLLDGVVGQFFRSLAFALGASILVSMVVSLFVIPLLLLGQKIEPSQGARERRWLVALQNAFATLVGAVLRRPVLTSSLVLGVFALCLLAAHGVETGFLPEMDEGGFVLDYSLPVGTSLAETDATCRRIENVLHETKEIAAFSRRTGAELGFFATEQFTGDMLVGLLPRDQRQRSVFEIMSELRRRFDREVPQAEIEFVQVMQDTINDLAGNPSPIEVKLLGAEYPVLQRAAKRVAGAIGEISGIVDVVSSVSFGSPEIAWHIDPFAAARLGLEPEAIATQLGAQSLGIPAARVREGERYLDLRVRYPEAWRMKDIDTDPYVGPVADAAAPGMVPLSAMASSERRLAENELEREDQVPVVTVSASLEGLDLGNAQAKVEERVALLDLDPSARIEFGGQAASQGRAFANLLEVFAIAAGLTFLLLVCQFRSLRLALVMVLALPFGQLGGLIALRSASIPLNLSSGMGLIMLVGLVVKNGIILIEYAQQRCADGMSERDSIIAASRVRLRPILMTTTAAIAGLVPLALGYGAGSELQRPLAVAVIGGLVISTFSTLVIVPLGCATLGRGRLQPEPAP